MDSYEWHDVHIKGFKPESRWGHSACLHNENKMVIFGGIHKVGLLNDTIIMTLSENGDTVSIDSELVNTRGSSGLNRCRHTANIHKDEMYVFGGIEDSENSLNHLWKLNLNDLIWRKCKTTGEQPKKRHSHRSVTFNDKIYIFGGYLVSDSQNTNDLFVLNPEELHWDRITPQGFIPGPMRGMTLQEDNGKMYLFGGHDGDSYSNESFVYDIRENIWDTIQTKNQPPAIRTNHTGVLYDEGIVIWGGVNNDEYFSNIYYLDLKPLMKQDKESEQQYIAQIKELYLSDLHSDVSFVVEGASFPAHKNILAVRCKYFASMFASGMQESRKDSIELPDVQIPAFRAIMEYIYCNQVKLTEKLAIDLLETSNKWVLTQLQEQCEVFLGENLTLENFSQIANLAQKFPTIHLMHYVLEFGTEHLERLEEKEDLYKLDQCTLVNFIFKVRCQDACKCKDVSQHA